MATVTASWMSVVALGVGLVHLGLAAGAPLLFGVAAAGLGLAEVAVALVIMVRGTIPNPRVLLALGLLPTVLAWCAGTVARSLELSALASALRALPLAIAAALGFALALGAALALRRGRAASSTHGSRSLPSVVALGLSAVVVAGLVTPALAATRAGDDAVPHGEHGNVQPSTPSKIELPDGHSGH